VFCDFVLNDPSTVIQYFSLEQVLRIARSHRRSHRRTKRPIFLGISIFLSRLATNIAPFASARDLLCICSGLKVPGVQRFARPSFKAVSIEEAGKDTESFHASEQ
jgi:hypothetical protein